MNPHILIAILSVSVFVIIVLIVRLWQCHRHAIHAQVQFSEHKSKLTSQLTGAQTLLAVEQANLKHAKATIETLEKRLTAERPQMHIFCETQKTSIIPFVKRYVVTFKAQMSYQGLFIGGPMQVAQETVTEIDGERVEKCLDQLVATFTNTAILTTKQALLPRA